MLIAVPESTIAPGLGRGAWEASGYKIRATPLEVPRSLYSELPEVQELPRPNPKVGNCLCPRREG